MGVILVTDWICQYSPFIENSRQAKDLIEICEARLPRNKHCVLTAVPDE